jgi:hypothetical protein
MPRTLTRIKEIKEEVEAAKERFRKREPVIPVINPREPIAEQLLDNLTIIKAQQKNVIIMQYAIIGEMLSSEATPIDSGMWSSEEDLMKFIAEIFKGEFESILHLRNMTPSSFKKLQGSDRKILLNSQKRKLKLEGHDPKELPRNKKRRISDAETTDTFQEWLDGNLEFLDGLLAPVEGSGTDLISAPPDCGTVA